MENKGHFFLQTFIMWILYFLMLYVCFYGFSPTAHLGLSAGLSALVIGSLGMVAPVQGGIGAWHFMVIQTLIIYSLPESDGQIFALVVHGSMTLLLVVGGAISLIALPLVNRKKDFV